MTPPGDPQPSELGRAVNDVVEKTQLLVREEIELAKAEVTEKVSKLIKGAIVGIVAGVFALLALFLLLHATSWAVWDLTNDLSDDNFWLGFLIVAIALLLLGAIAGALAYRFIKKGSPPTPEMAIEEAQLIKETYSTPAPAHRDPEVHR
jgi:H+/Cl- antiporter ClcA